MKSLTVFRQDNLRWALGLSVSERVVSAMEVTPLPRAPEAVLGVIDLHGQIVPVFETRKRFGLPARDLALTDVFVIVRTARRTVAMIADEALGVEEYPEEAVVAASRILPEIEYVSGVAKLPDGLLFIHDPDKFLSLEEEAQLEDALGGQEDT